MDPRIQSGSTTQTSYAQSGETHTSRAEDQHHVGELLQRLGRETFQLVRQETALARTEIGENLASAKRGAMALASSLGIVIPGITLLLFGAAYGLAERIALWAAMLIVGGAALVIGIVLALVGKKKLEASNLEPTQTRQTLRENQRFLREQVST